MSHLRAQESPVIPNSLEWLSKVVVDSSGQPLTEVLWLPWYPGGPAGPSAAGPKDATTKHATLKGPGVTCRPEQPGMVTEDHGGLAW